MKYLIALVFIAMVVAVILVFWMSTHDMAMRSVRRDRTRARWHPVARSAVGKGPETVWVVLRGPSGYEFDHKKIGIYTDGPQQAVLWRQAEASAKFLNDRIDEDLRGRHSRRMTP